MNSMPAVEMKFKEMNETSKVVRPLAKTKSKKKASSKKVIKLFPEQPEYDARPISDADREELILNYRLKARKLARSILRKWHSRLDLNEVDSIVDLSLCEAVRRYNPAKGASFMTFLFYHLKGNLIRGVTAAACANLVPILDEEMNDSNGEERGESKVGSARFVNAIEAAEAISGRGSVQPDEALLKKELLELSFRACSKLDQLEREVIFRIYLHGQQLIDIAHNLGYSRCHISRVKRKALETLSDELGNTLEGAKQTLRQLAAEVKNGAGFRRPSKRNITRRRSAARKEKNNVVRLSA